MSNKIQIPKVYNQFMKELHQDNYTDFVLTGGRGGAKSYTAGLGVLSLASSGKKKILCLREIQKSIRDSVHDLLGQQISLHNFPGYGVGEKYIKNIDTGSLFLFAGMYRNPESIKSIPEIDVAWMEEANGFSKKSIDIIIPTIRGETVTDVEKVKYQLKNQKRIWTFNPGEETDPIWEHFMMCPKKNTFYLHTTYLDNPFCKPDFIEEAEELKEKDYDEYCHIYLGDLRKQGEGTLISASDVQTAIDRQVNDEGMYEYGVDCARFGDDSTIITERKGLKLTNQWEYSKQDVVQVADFVMFHVKHKNCLIKIDVGYMPGVYDIIKSKGYHRAIPIAFNESAKDKDKYNNIISEMWWEFNDLLPDIQLINNAQLKKELTTRKRGVDKKGRFRIEPKDEYKKRGYKSPDRADSALLCFYNHKSGGYFSFT